ncbi:hypothetical protein F5B21DRAFT_509731 [Xylaria acuta]|nr:hypothetical protein F5B21DRAFT_509731 [Xylaria acuta]
MNPSDNNGGEGGSGGGDGGRGGHIGFGGERHPFTSHRGGRGGGDRGGLGGRGGFCGGLPPVPIPPGFTYVMVPDGHGVGGPLPQVGPGYPMSFPGYPSAFPGYAGGGMGAPPYMAPPYPAGGGGYGGYGGYGGGSGEGFGGNGGTFAQAAGTGALAPPAGVVVRRSTEVGVDLTPEGEKCGMFDRKNPENDVAVQTSGYLAYSGNVTKVPAVVDYFVEDQKVEPGDKVFMQLHKYSKRRLRKQIVRSRKHRRSLGINNNNNYYYYYNNNDDDRRSTLKSGIPSRSFGFVLPGSSGQNKGEKPTEAEEVEDDQVVDGGDDVPDDDDLDNIDDRIEDVQ